MHRVKRRTHANTANASPSSLRLTEERDSIIVGACRTTRSHFNIFCLCLCHLLLGHKHLDDEDADEDEGGAGDVVFKAWHLYSPVLREPHKHKLIFDYC